MMIIMCMFVIMMIIMCMLICLMVICNNDDDDVYVTMLICFWEISWRNKLTTL